MKELSIEEKAKRYDEAIERARKLKEDPQSVFNEYSPKEGDTISDYIFPELKESEDEKIRKELIRAFKSLNTIKVWNGIERTDILTWLEKQGKLSIFNIPSREIILAIWDLGNEWKELTNGSISTEYGTQLDYIQKHWQESEYYLKAKQGEQKPADKVEPKFHEGDWVVSPNGVYWHIDKISNNRYEVTSNTGKGSGCWNLDTNIYHKFTIQDAKDGDVLSDGTTIFIFKDLLSDGSVMSYCDYDTDSGESDVFCPLSMNLICSKITPATKEQRDTLMKAMANAGYTFDFGKKKLRKIGYKLAWSEEDDNCLSTIIAEFSKCAGKSVSKDEWMRCNDFLNSLRDRVQPKQEWSEEDESNLDLAIYHIRREPYRESDVEPIVDWLRTLKDRVLPQPKQEWSEEDKQYFNFLEKLLVCLQSKSTENEIKRGTNSNSEYYYEVIQWLKSIRPQNRWKPSDKQMSTLEYYMHTLTCNEYKEILFGLYTDLKKLREE